MPNIKWISAAIAFIDNKNEEVEWYGLRHHLIIKDIHDAGLEWYYKRWHEDGFLVEFEGVRMFISRNAATEYAKKLGIKMESPSVLTSEDLWDINGNHYEGVD